MMPATIKDIAKMTNLGLATISAYLNGNRVLEKNRILIENAIKELGYVRNEYARGLKTRRTKTIGILIPELSNIFCTSVICSLEDVLYPKGYSVIVCDCQNNQAKESQMLDFLMSKMVDGIIVMPVTKSGEELNKVLNNNVPIITLDRLTENKKVPSIIINNRQAAKEAVQKIIAKGYKKIALISGSDYLYTARERTLGYIDAMQEINAYDTSLIYDGDMCLDGGYTAMKQIINDHADIQAVFMANYEMTIGTMLAINDSRATNENLDNLCLVGFDNLALAKLLSPKISTVCQPLEKIGQTAADMILDIINKKPVENVELKAIVDIF